MWSLIVHSGVSNTTLTLSLLRLQSDMSNYIHQSISKRIEKGKELLNPQDNIIGKLTYLIRRKYITSNFLCAFIYIDICLYVLCPLQN